MNDEQPISPELPYRVWRVYGMFNGNTVLLYTYHYADEPAA